MPSVSATDFHKAFVMAYGDGRRQLSQQQWDNVWHARPDRHPNWDDFMLNTPAGVDDSVIGKAAAYLGVTRCLREPMHLDAVFYEREQDDWFPMLVAIEHENVPTTFYTELRRLLSIRAPLKVGITYAFGPNETNEAALRNEHARDVYDTICCAFRQMNFGEDPATEYLFLLGCRMPELKICWRSLAFSTGADPGALTFEGAPPIDEL